MRITLAKNEISILVLIIISIFSGEVLAKTRTCITPQNLCEAYEFYERIHIGKVIRVKEYKVFREYTLRVISTLKGKKDKTIKAISYKRNSDEWTDCKVGSELKQNETYLLYLSVEAKKGNLNTLYAGKFNPRVIGEATQEIKELKKIALLNNKEREKCRPWEKLQSTIKHKL